MLRLEGIYKSLGGVPVLKDVNLSIPEGVTHALIGTSGSGKTTLLRITLGLIPMDKGWVKINNQPLSSFLPADWANQIGYVPQSGGLFPHLTAGENAVLVARLRGWTAAEILRRTEEVRQLVDLAPEILLRYPRELSGGQKQKVAIMRAAFLNPSVFLLDEPMASLDPLMRQSLQLEFKSIFKKLGKTVILVTHDLGEAVFLSSQMTLMHEGRVVQSGTFRDFQKSPADPFVTQFINAYRILPGEEELS